MFQHKPIIAHLEHKVIRQTAIFQSSFCSYTHWSKLRKINIQLIDKMQTAHLQISRLLLCVPHSVVRLGYQLEVGSVLPTHLDGFLTAGNTLKQK